MIYRILTLTLACVLHLTCLQADIPQTLVLNMENISKLPRNFRIASDSFIRESDRPIPSRQGLDELNISCSGQFSEKSLAEILETIDYPQNIIIVDLREESHGFINGHAVVWYAPRGWGNIGLNPLQVLQAEAKLIHDIPLNEDIIINKIVQKDRTGEALPLTTPIPTLADSVKTEAELSQQFGISYMRIPITDHMRPSDAAVDHIVQFINQLPQDTWLHAHCAAGIGRATTFMVMYDMIKNAKNVSFEDILERNWRIGGTDLRKVKEGPWKYPYVKERLSFIRSFYDYCKNNEDGFQQSWTEYLNK